MSAAEDFEEFVAIVEAGSLTAAARELGLPRPTVSRRLARLEARLGVRLLHRTTRRLAPTPQGLALYPKARQVVQNARDVEAAVRRLDGVPRGLLRVCLPLGMPSVVAGWVADFLGRHPQVRLETVASAEHLDLVAGGFDVALRFGPLSDGSLVARTLFTTRLIAVASPTYLARCGTPQSVSDLVNHDCLVGFRGGYAPSTAWPLLAGGSIPVTGRWASNDVSLQFHGALRHRGVALVSERLAADALADGALVHLLADTIGHDERVSVVYPDRTYLDPKVRAFVDMLAAYFSAG